MKHLTTLLLATGFLAGMTASAGAAQDLTVNNSPAVAQSPAVNPALDSGFDGQARAVTVTGKKHTTTLDKPPVPPAAAPETNHYRRGGGEDLHSNFGVHQKTWQAAPYQLEPKGSGTSHKVQPLSKSGLGARTGQTGADPNAVAQQALSETSKDSQNDLRDQMKAVQEQNKKKKAQRDFAAQQHRSAAAAKPILKHGALNPPPRVSVPGDAPPPGSQISDANDHYLHDREQDAERKNHTLKKSSESRHDTDKNAISNVR